jgi:hypothetical protein
MTFPNPESPPFPGPGLSAHNIHNKNLFLNASHYCEASPSHCGIAVPEGAGMGNWDQDWPHHWGH